MGKADSFLTGAQRRNLGVDDVVPDGRFAGKTVREIYGILQQQEQGYSGLQQSANSGEMTIEEAMQGGFNSPDPRSYRVPYGPFQGMSMDQLAQRYKEQQSYLQDNGFVAKEPEEPGMLEQFIPLASGIGAGVTSNAISSQLSGQSGLNAQLAAESAARTAAETAARTATETGAQATSVGTNPLLGAARPPVPPASPVGAPPGAPTPVAGAGSSGASGLGSASGFTPYGTSLDPVATSGYGSSILGGGTSSTPVFGVNPAVGPAAVAGAGLQYELSNLAKDPKQWLKGDEKFNGINGASIIRNKVAGALGFDGRHEGVYQRESNRNAFRDDSQIYTGNDIGLAGGNSFNIGSNRNTETTNIDWDKAKGTPGDEDLISRLDSLTVALSPLAGDQRAWQTGEFYNAATSSGDSMANVQQMFKNSGRTYEEIRQGIREATDISEQERQVHLANVDVVEQYGGPTPAAVLPGQQAKAATLPAPTTASVDRNAGRPAPVFNDPLAVNLAPKAAPGQKKGSTRLKAFWGQ